MVSKFDEIPWNEIIKKEARGIDDADFGEIQSVDPEYVLTQKGIIDKEFFSFPKNLVQGYDGDRVWFKVTEEEARNSYMQSQNVNLVDQGDFSSNNIETKTIDDNSLSNTKEEKIIPLMAEKLDIAKTEVVDEVIITKEPVKDTKTEQIPVMHEELTIEIRPVTNDHQSSLQSSNINNNNTSNEQNEILKPVENKTHIRIPLKREEVEVSRTPYVKEEIVVKKKPVSGTQTVTEELVSEKIIDPQI
jgi:uncharacterized protein (TIGR02271 family)